MNHCISLINGKFRNTISVLDRGLAYGDGFFETMLWDSNGKYKEEIGVEFWNRHLKRINKGCKLMKINIPGEQEILNQRNKILFKSKANGMDSGLLKLIITRGVGGRGYKFEKNMIASLIFLSFEKPQLELKNYESGVRVRLCKTKLSINKNLSGLKHLNRLDSVLARSEWEDDSFEGIFVDSEKNIIEGTMTNIFFIKKNVLITPTILDSGISGVMRQVVIDEGKRFFDEVIEKKINLIELKDFDQMFLTNSVLKIMPVKLFNEKKFSIKSNQINLMNFFNVQNSDYKKLRLGLV